MVGVCVVDTLLHRLTGRVEHILIGHIADGLTVHLHLQRIRLADGMVKHGHHNGQCAHRQHIHGHARQCFQVAAHAAGQIMYAGFAGCGKAFFFPHPLGVHQQRTAAPEEQPDRAEQVPEHLRCPRERHCRSICQQCRKCLPQPQPAAAQAAPNADESILCRIAQCIQRLPDDWHGRILGKLSAKIIHMILGFTAQPVPVQKPHALQLCPKGAQPLAAFRFYR